MERKAVIIGASGAANAIFFFVCHLLLAENPGSGPEGIGTAFLILFSVFVSAILSAGALNVLYGEFQKGFLTRKTIFATGLAAAPLAYYILVDVLPYRR